MARAPFQVLVYPYRRTPGGTWEYALFRRSDAGFWQGIAGGGEDGESPLQAARREAVEEGGVTAAADRYLALATVVPIPATEFRDSHLWGDDRFVIPQYCFGVLVDDGELTLSHEHSEYRWLPYAQATPLLRFDGNKTALWELDARLRGRGPRG